MPRLRFTARRLRQSHGQLFPAYFINVEECRTAANLQSPLIGCRRLLYNLYTIGRLIRRIMRLTRTSVRSVRLSVCPARPLNSKMNRLRTNQNRRKRFLYIGVPGVLIINAQSQTIITVSVAWSLAWPEVN